MRLSYWVRKWWKLMKMLEIVEWMSGKRLEIGVKKISWMVKVGVWGVCGVWGGNYTQVPFLSEALKVTKVLKSFEIALKFSTWTFNFLMNFWSKKLFDFDQNFSLTLTIIHFFLFTNFLIPSPPPPFSPFPLNNTYNEADIFVPILQVNGVDIQPVINENRCKPEIRNVCDL